MCGRMGNAEMASYLTGSLALFYIWFISGGPSPKYVAICHPSDMVMGKFPSIRFSLDCNVKWDMSFKQIKTKCRYMGYGLAIQCYQCDSNEDETCPSGYGFDKTVNAMLDCNGFEADIPGQFCVKIYQESPGWGGWQKTTRRCGSRTTFGVAWGCRWSWDYTGVFMETCYCEDKDGCNSSTHFTPSIILVFCSFLTTLYILLSHL